MSERQQAGDATSREREEWEETTLGDVAELVRGVTYKSSELGEAGEGVPFLSLKSVAPGGGFQGVYKTFTGTVKPDRVLASGDLVIAVTEQTRDYTLIGASALVPEALDGTGATFSMDLVKVKPRSEVVSTAFLNCVLQGPNARRFMAEHAPGMKVLHLRTREVPSFEFLLPPLHTQERIVEVISAIDDQLTALNTEAESLSPVLCRRRADHMTDKSVEQVRAEHAFDFSTGVRRTPDRASGPYMTPYLRSANVGYGTLDLSDVLEMNYDPAEREKFGLRYGDVVVSEGSASAKAVGMPAMWRDELPAPVCTQMTLLRLRALEGICIPEFAFHWSMWAYESGAFLDVAGGTSIKHISAKRSKGMAVRLPSIDRQHEVVAELDVMEATLRALRAEVTRLRQVRARLLSGLLDRTIDIEVAELKD
ncbi:restriction endonuclease subunit S [Spongiactinospora sp. TRM90649]|uniref:restriction endonuclease subunit S n=1 Tax=Spongiactinospora sp. TRM90649 TaxID=3031114 RepID=UPI0023F76FC0|nr:restriction endonuclease subunit S [Spongiactinospora sp. TRM90649]MDF5758382.1 restriction endonuclease subunit S [Spongiactinospora sp. TRM90649]